MYNASQVQINIGKFIGSIKKDLSSKSQQTFSAELTVCKSDGYKKGAMITFHVNDSKYVLYFSDESDSGVCIEDYLKGRGVI